MTATLDSPRLTPPPPPTRVRRVAAVPPARRRRQTPAEVLCVTLALWAGVAAPFTVNLVGQMPLGEIVLLGAGALAVCSLALTHRWPSPLLASRPLFWMFGALVVSFAGYVVADLWRGSAGNDLVRGWARLAFLAGDLWAMAFLFGVTPRAFLALQLGLAEGAALEVKLHGALFDDYWKFGYAMPVTVFLLLVSPRLGRWAAALAAAGIGCVHLALSFRSLGAECLLVASLLVLVNLPRRTRGVLLPVFVAAGVAAFGLVHLRNQGEENADRATRSNVERGAMMAAAWEGFTGSPVIGQGSWFSRSEVMNRFVDLRTARAEDAGIGGFATDEADEGITLHSQILVSLAEGGILGGTFFFAYAGTVLWALWHVAVRRRADGFSPLYLLILAGALSNLLFTPFSGVHRVHIACAAAVALLCWVRRHRDLAPLGAPARWRPRPRRERKTRLGVVAADPATFLPA